MNPCYVKLVNGALMGRVDPVAEFAPLHLSIRHEEEEKVHALLALHSGCTLKLTAKQDMHGWRTNIEVVQ